jgi:Ca2+-binding RTX toxin-like protein
VIPVVAIAALVVTVLSPASFASPDGPRCFGRPATIVGTAAFDHLVGTEGPDVIVGLVGGDTIEGLGGNDFICGGRDHDAIEGGDGDDRLAGGDGVDSIQGGDGDDRLQAGTTDYEFLYGGPGDDVIRGQGDFDWFSLTLAGSGAVVDLQAGTSVSPTEGMDLLYGIEGVLGSPFNDTILGDNHINILEGGEGIDLVDGRGDRDWCIQGETQLNCERPFG